MDHPEHRRWPRLAAMSRTGRFVALRAGDGLEVVDAIGTAPRRTIAGPAVIDFACVGAVLWVLRPGQLDRYRLEHGRPIEPTIAVPSSSTGLEAIATADAAEALVIGPEPVWVHADHDRVEVVAVPPAPRLWPLGGRRLAIGDGGSLRITDLGRAAATPLWSGSAEILAVHPVMAGRALAILTDDGGAAAYLLIRPDGKGIHRVAVPRATRWAVAIDRGLAILSDGGTALTLVDLRFGRIQAEGVAAAPVLEVELDADGRFVLLGHRPAPDRDPGIAHQATSDLFPTRAEAATAAAPPELATLRGHALTASAPGPAPELAPPPTEAPPPPPPPPIARPPLAAPLALGAPLPPLQLEASSPWPPYGSPREHLGDMLDWVAARVARAIAEAWNTGRLTAPVGGERPFAREVSALLGHAAGLAPDELAASDERLAELATRNAGRVRATIAGGIRLPFIELLRELDLSPTAGHILMVAMAPALRGEIARLFGILGNDAQRPVIDRFLVETILARSDREIRIEVALELAADAPLLRYGVLRLTPGAGGPMFDALTVDPTALERIRARVARPAVDAVRRHDQLAIPDDVIVPLGAALASPRRPGEPVRLVVRGRRGSGRRSLVAAFAAEVGRSTCVIDCLRMPRGGAAMAAALRAELTRALLRGAIPVISGLEAADPADPEGQDRLRDVLRAHPGPIAIRAAPEASLPLDPGHLTATLPALSETERAGFWRDALARAGLPCASPDVLAARWRIGPGVIEEVIAQAVAQRAAASDDADDTDDATALLHEIARQHVTTRLDHVASPVRRLARWEQVALPDDLLDSIREFIGRVEHRRTVYEQWGFDATMSSARGLTALFYGPPGTGKSMVAGLIARELGLDLYRVDLSRVVSKWIGETEKNLAEVFDAAEDGQVVILFDEADSLFARRTEVKTSVDRYANLEVNYILQRLDSFEGIAILTTNLEGSIDPAFKRRMSLRLNFPFPDDDMRRRLWEAHIPAEAPVAGDLDFDELARRFPLSGGYIRNSALRAAFLAAQEQRPLGQEHLLRAIALEYRELGKLSASGRME